MSEEYEKAWLQSAQGKFDSIKYAIVELGKLYVDYIRRKDHSRMDKDKMIETMDLTAMYIAEFLHIMGAKKMNLYDMFVAFYQKTMHSKGLSIESYLLDDLNEGMTLVLNEMKQEKNGEFI